MRYLGLFIPSFFLSLIALAAAIVGTALQSEGYPSWLMVLCWVLFGVFTLLCILSRILHLIHYIVLANKEEETSFKNK